MKFLSTTTLAFFLLVAVSDADVGMTSRGTKSQNKSPKAPKTTKAPKPTKAPVVSRKCADGSDVPPACDTADSQYCSLYGIDPGLGGQYCNIYGVDPKQGALLATVVFTSFTFDSSGAFLQTCLPDLLGATLLGNENQNRQVCEDGKTEIALYSTVESSSIPVDSKPYNVVDGVAKTDIGWLIPMCKSAQCDAGVLKQVLSETFLDFFDFVDSGWRTQGWDATSTVIPTGECVYDQIGAAVRNPELYCSDDAPACSNMKLAEITIADDAPFEVAICDDNDCLTSVGAVDIVGYHATGPMLESFVMKSDNDQISQNDPFCISNDFPNFVSRNQKYVSAKILDKAFDKTNYCTAAAARERMGRCGPCSDSNPKSTKAPKAPKATKAPKAPKAPNQGSIKLLTRCYLPSVTV